MSLPGLSIRLPVLAVMVNAVIILFGIIAFNRIGVDRFPYIEFPVVSVSTTLPGANPDIVDSSITNVIETSVNGVSGIDDISSYSRPGVSSVSIKFNLDKNIDVAFNEVQAKINQVLRRLPDDADPPVVSKVEIGASPVMWLTLTGDRTIKQLNLYANNVLKKSLETIDGVGEVRLGGRRDRTIRVELIPENLAAFGLTPVDVLKALNDEHIQLPAGYLVSKQAERLLKLDMEFHNVEDLEKLVVAYRDGAPIRLKDIAVIKDAIQDKRTVARFNSKPSVGLGIVKIANTNTVEIVNEVKRRIETDIRPSLPPGLHLEIAVDDSSFILEMVRALEEHLLMGSLLASLVVFVFLKSLRSTFIIATAFPISIFGSVAVIYLFGFTINTMTLLALLLLIGIVVDDAIVVLENIYRHRQKIDPNPISAAMNGTNQVVFAVLAATLTLISIFAPVIFMEGIIGRFFNSFAVVVTFGVIVSWFVSMTLTPMLCSRFLEVGSSHGRLYNKLESWFNAFEDSYRRLLQLSLEHRWKVLFIALLIVLSSIYFMVDIGKGFMPEEDEGEFNIMARAPLGSSVDYTDGRMQEIEKVLKADPGIASYFTATGFGGGSAGASSAFAFVHLKPRSERAANQKQIMDRVRKNLSGIPGVKSFPSQVSMVGGSNRGEDLQFIVRGPQLEEVASYSQQLYDRLSKRPELGRLDLDLQLDMPQTYLNVDRLRASSMGITSRDLALAVNLMAGGLDVAKYNDLPGDGERYDIRLKGKEDEFQTTNDLKKIYIRASNGELVRLDTVVDIQERIGPAVISRYNLQYAAMFYSDPEVPLSDAIDIVQDAAKDILPTGYSLKMVGQSEEFSKTVNYMLFAFAMALVLVYMVLASQFNSFLQPFVIMLAQPLAMIGGIVALWLTGNTLNIFSMIGLVLLVGLVAKNSILLIDMTNQYRHEGMSIHEALIEACPIRLRPILMTSLTIILALTPAAMKFGAGADTNGPLSIAVIGGMITSTLLTLVVVPAAYSLVEHGVQKFKSRSRKTPVGLTEVKQDT